MPACAVVLFASEDVQHNTFSSMLLSVNDLVVALGTSRETIWRWRKSGGFPQPIKRYKNYLRWRSQDIADWLGIPEEELLRPLREQKQTPPAVMADGGSMGKTYHGTRYANLQ